MNKGGGERERARVRERERKRIEDREDEGGIRGEIFFFFLGSGFLVELQIKIVSCKFSLYNKGFCNACKDNQCRLN